VPHLVARPPRKEKRIFRSKSDFACFFDFYQDNPQPLRVAKLSFERGNSIMNNISSLMRELNALVESRTFTAEAAGGIAKLRDQAIAAEKKIADLEDQLKNARTSNSALDSNNAKLNARLNEWKAREESLAAREKKMTELERDLAVANAKGAAFDEIRYAN
jgi:septal ring factor EnvC (AmiA/AmiB activator)